jgi:hypothetical protein
MGDAALLLHSWFWITGEGALPGRSFGESVGLAAESLSASVAEAVSFALFYS